MKTRQVARKAKIIYDEAVARRSNSQQEANYLLQRKPDWADGDIDRVATLLKREKEEKKEEMRAKAAVSVADDAVDREFSELCVICY